LKKPDQPVLMAAGANVVEDRMQRQGREIDLSPKEFSLLELLMRHAGQPVSRSAIYLRRKVDVGFELALIRTVRGVGYPIGANVAAV
jgi:DNA-binding response OmpR family regulator